MNHIEHMMKLYEEGIGLVRTCSAKLDEAEAKIKLLNVTADGVSGESDFS